MLLQKFILAECSITVQIRSDKSILATTSAYDINICPLLTPKVSANVKDLTDPER